MPEQKITNVLEWRAGSVAAAVQANEKVGKSVADVATKSNIAATALTRGTETAKAGAVAYANEAEAAKALGLSLEQLGVKADVAQQGDVEAVTKQLGVEKQITAEMQKQIDANDRNIRGRIGSGSEGVNTGFNTLRAAGAAVGNIGGGQSVTQAASLIGLAELGPAALAAGVLGIGLKTLTDNANKAAEAIAASAKAYRDVAVSALTSTRAEFEAERDALQLRVELQDQLAVQANKAVADYVQNTEGFGIANLVIDGTYKGLVSSADAANTTLTETQNELNAYNLVLAEQGDLAGDAAAATELFASQLEEATSKTTDKILGVAQTTLQIENQTAEERQKASDQLRLQIGVLTQFRDENKQTEESYDSLTAQIETARANLDAYADVTSTYADYLARINALEQQRMDRNDQYLDAVDREVAAREKAFDIQTKIADITADRDTKLAEQQADYYDRRQDVQTAANEKSLEDTATAEERRQKIMRDAGRSFDEAIGNRDANAYRLANIRAQDALADADDASKKAIETTVKAQVKQLAALDKGYEKQVQSARTAAANQLAVQQGLLAQQQFLAQSAAAAQQFITASGVNNMVNTNANGWNNVVNIAAVSLNTIGGLVRGIVSGVQQGQTFPTLSSTYPGGPSWQNQQIDRRIAQTIRGGREITQ